MLFKVLPHIFAQNPLTLIYKFIPIAMTRGGVMPYNCQAYPHASLCFTLCCSIVYILIFPQTPNVLLGLNLSSFKIATSVPLNSDTNPFNHAHSLHKRGLAGSNHCFFGLSPTMFLGSHTPFSQKPYGWHTN